MNRPASDDEGIIDDYGRRFIARKHRFPASVGGYLVAPTTWFAYFVSVYAAQGAGCAARLDAIRIGGVTLLELLLGALTLGASAVFVIIGLWSFAAWRRLLRELDDAEHAPRHSAFLAYGALLHAGLFLVATLWSGVPILLTDACDNLGST